MHIDLPEGIRPAQLADWRRLGSILSEAFREDPVNMWIFGNEAALAPVFGLLARRIYLPGGICHLDGDEAATMWCLNSRRRALGSLSTLALIWALIRHGSDGAVKRALSAGEAMARHHPQDEHLYLFMIGTRSAARGRGHGGRLLAPVLQAADTRGLACYLENTNPANSAFYRRHGFDRTEIFPAGPGGPPMEGIWRRPQPRESE